MSSQTVRVLLSFYAARDDGSVNSEPIHKEKFSVPLCERSHKKLSEFKKHIMAFTDLKTIAIQKGIGHSFEVTVARVSKNSKGGTDVFSIRTQDSWSHEWPEISSGNGMIQVSVCQKVTAWVSGPVLLVKETETSTTSEAKKELPRQSIKSRKRPATKEDEAMNAMLRGGKTVKRNSRQEQELAELKEALSKHGNSTTEGGLHVRCGLCEQQFRLPLDRKTSGKVSYFNTKHYQKCTKLHANSQNETCERSQSLLSSWITRPAATTSTDIMDIMASPPPVSREDPLDMTDGDLKLE